MSSESRKTLLQGFELLGRQMSTGTILFHNAVSEATGLSSVELKAVDILDRLGPLTAGELSLQTGLTTGAVTSLIDRLQDKHIAARRTDPEDRRKVIVELLHNQKLQRIGSMYDSLSEAWQTLLNTYSEPELRLISDFLQRSAVMMHEETGKVSSSRRSKTNVSA